MSAITVGTAIRPVTAVDLGTLSHVLARAFANDSIMRYVLPDDRVRAERLPEVYRLYLEVFMRLGVCHTNADRDCAALWLPPGTHPLSMLQRLRLLPGMAGALGLTSLLRAQRVLGHLDGIHPKGDDCWYLGVLGVSPDRQGRGLGGRLIEPVLQACDEARLGCWLETGMESNVAYYAARGFRTRSVSRIRDGPQVWGMWRDARPA